MNPNDQIMTEMLTNARTIAVVGHSDKPFRTSYQIASFLRHAGYEVYPVNPTISNINGHTVYTSLSDLPITPDVVNVFRRSEHLFGVTEEAISSTAKGVWAQIGVMDDNARKVATEANITFVMNRCIMVEHQRLSIPYVE